MRSHSAIQVSRGDVAVQSTVRLPNRLPEHVEIFPRGRWSDGLRSKRRREDSEEYAGRPAKSEGSRHVRKGWSGRSFDREPGRTVGYELKS